MATASVDLVAPGPFPDDPYDPAAPAWTLALGLKARHLDVRVVYPTTEGAPPPPAGLAAEGFPALPPHLGYARGDAELARAARRHLRPGVEVVVRDPLRPGPLGAERHGRLVGLVRRLEIDALPTPGGPAASVAGGSRGRWGRWRERATVRRLEAAALKEADVLLCEGRPLADRLRDVYGFDTRAAMPIGRGVNFPDAPTDRRAARLAIGVPPDDPVVVAVAPLDDKGHVSLAAAREAFQRLRPIFAGAHLVLAGAAADAGNGVTVRPARSLEQFVLAIGAGDLAVFAGPRPPSDPGVALALRLGVCPIVARGAELPAEVEPAVRRVDGGTPELASAIAELLADPAGRRALGADAAKIAGRFSPTSVADELLSQVSRAQR